MDNVLSIPKLGESVSQATIIKWLVSEGDTVEKDQPYVEIATDKVDSEIPAPYKCKILKILKAENEQVDVNEPIAEVEWLEKVSTQKQEKSKKKITEAPTGNKLPSKTPRAKSEDRLSPLVRKILYRNNIDSQELMHIVGTGENGRITKDDALSYIANRGAIQSDMPFEKSEPKRSLDTAHVEVGDEAMPFDRMQALTARYISFIFILMLLLFLYELVISFLPVKS